MQVGVAGKSENDTMVVFGFGVFVIASGGRGEIVRCSEYPVTLLNPFSLVFPLIFPNGVSCRPITPWMGRRMVSQLVERPESR